MPQNFFAGSDTDTLYPFGGTEYWITVKQELTAGEERSIYQAALKRNVVGGIYSPELDIDNGAFMKVATRLVDWNLANANGQTTDIKQSRQHKIDALRALLPESFRAIETAIDAYVTARVQEKKPLNGSNGGTAPSESSPSADSSAGVGRSTARRRSTSSSPPLASTTN